MKLLPIDTEDLSAYIPGSSNSNLDPIPKKREAESFGSSIFAYGFFGVICVFDGDKLLTTQSSIFDSGTIGEDAVVQGGQDLGFGLKFKNIADFSSQEQSDYNVEANEIKNIYFSFMKVNASGILQLDRSTDVIFKLSSDTSGVTLSSMKFSPNVDGEVKDASSHGWLFDSNSVVEHIGGASGVSMPKIGKDDFFSLVLPYDTYPNIIVARHSPDSNGEIGSPIDYKKIKTTDLSTVFGSQKWAVGLLGQSKYKVENGSRTTDIAEQTVFNIDKFEVLGDQ